MKPVKHPAPVIACVKWGEQYGAYYVNTLYAMVRRNLPEDCAFRFECFTDDPAGLHPSVTPRALPGDLTGWWNKLHLFREGVFGAGQRVIYFDLDTLIIGGIEALLQYQGDLALLSDFYVQGGYGSGVMLWRADACHGIWSHYEAAGRPQPTRGDQAWIETAYPGADLLQDCFPEMFASYKTQCLPLPPPGTRVVCFHGEPKQDNCDATWVREVWKPDGLHSLRLGAHYPTKQEEALANMRHAIARPYALVERMPAHDRHAVIIGGGATLNDCREELQGDIGQGHTVFAVNGAPLWLTANRFRFDAHVMGNAREEHAALVQQEDVPCYYSSTCPASVLERVGERLVLWHPAIEGAAALLKDDPRPAHWIEASLSTGLSAVSLAHLLGYRRFHLYGFDSCDTQGAHHACGWPGEERNRRFTAELRGRRFQGSMWMMRQADEFLRLGDTLLKEGCTISIHGDGMLHYLAARAQSKHSLTDASAHTVS
jgi:uncharacterized Rossmann fold enzyme